MAEELKDIKPKARNQSTQKIICILICPDIKMLEWSLQVVKEQEFSLKDSSKDQHRETT